MTPPLSGRKQDATCGLVVQARVSSKRLPGKTLRKIGSRSLLECVIARLRPWCADNGIPIRIATSRRKEDDALETLCGQLDIPCFRGELEDVAARLLALALAEGWKGIIRISGDSPFIDPRVVDRALQAFTAGRQDVVTNVHPRSFPPGQSVEIFRTETLSQTHADMTEEEREHVGLHFYRNEKSFHILNLDSGTAPASCTRMTVDTLEDENRMARLMAALGGDAGDMPWEELVLRLKERDVGVPSEPCCA